MRIVLLYRYKFAILAQSVERVHGKDEVPGSIPGDGSRKQNAPLGCILCELFFLDFTCSGDRHIISSKYL